MVMRMRFATFELKGHDFPGAVREDTIIKLDALQSLEALHFSGATDLLPFIRGANDGILHSVANELSSLTVPAISEMVSEGKACPLKEVRLKAPLRPPAVFCLGFNYRSHAPELRRPVPEVPVIFMKPSSAVVGPEEDVVLPKVAERVDYEVELTIVIGSGGRYITKGDAYSRVFGYTILNDITARDIQRRDFSLARPWLRSKGFDTFAPLGPFIVTQEEVGDPMDLELKLTVDGHVKQQARTREMIFDIPTIIEYISSFTTLEPGAVIATGTPENIGPLHDGEMMDAIIEKIGVLPNRVVAEKLP
jgi:2-keto-4-pentenoate hydratase/2-oxohepta-3-ene-1,7-dioic acid hydratase in catechol pathway